MQNSDSITIVERFFSVIDLLIQEKKIRGVQTFTNRYGINRRNFLSLRSDKSRNIFQVCWLGYLVNDFGIDAHWLLTGEGDYFRSEFSQKTAKKPQMLPESKIKTDDK